MPSRKFFSDIQVETGDIFVPGMTAGTDTNIVYYDTVTGQLTYGLPPADSIDGSGDANRVAYWSDTDTLTSEAGFTYNSGQFLLPSGSEIGIGETSPDSVIHATGSFSANQGFVTLENTSTTNLGIEFTWDGSSFKRILLEAVQSGTNGAEFRVYGKPDAAQVARIFFRIDDAADVTIEEGDLIVPAMTAATQSNIVYYDTATGRTSYGLPPADAVTGSGATGRVTYWSTSNTLTSAADFLFNGSVLTVPSDAVVGNLSITFAGDTNTGIQGTASDQILLRANGETVAVFSYNVSATQTQLSGNVLVSDGHVNINDQFELQLQEDVASGNAYVALRAGTDMTGNGSGTYTITFPETAPAGGNALIWNASGGGALQWLTPLIGPGTSTHIPYYSDTNTLSNEAAFTYNSGTNTLTVDNIQLSLGAEGTPSLSFQGDTDTGIYSPSADIISFSSAGTNMLDIDNVSTDKGLILKSGQFLAPNTGPTIPEYSFSANTGNGFGYFDLGGSNNGWTAQVNNTNVFYAFSSSGFLFVFYVNLGGGVNFSGTDAIFQASSQIRADTTGTAAAPAIVFNNTAELDTGIYRPAADTIAFSSQGTQWITLDGPNFDFEMLAESTISFGDADSSDFVSLKAPSALSASYTLVFPDAAPADGEVLSWSTSGSAFVWSTGGGGSGEAVQFDLNQPSPTLALLDAVYHDGTNWQKAQADDPSTLGTHVVISASGSDYTLCQAGRVTATSHGLTVGDYYFTSSATAGLLTATEPSQYSNPLVYVEDANTIHILPFRPSAINGEFVPTYVKTIGIDSPTSSENIALFFTDDAITITQINDVCRGTTPSVTWNIAHATTRNNGTPNELFSSDRVTTSLTGAETTTFNDATIPAGSWVWLTTSATSGTVNEFTVSLEYTRD